jgi:ABC-2 type transport system permease protein
MIFAIASRELRSLFVSPLGWSLLAVLQCILGLLFWMFTNAFLERQPRQAGLENAAGVTDSIIVPQFSWLVVLMLLVMPLITMRLISEEHRGKTLPLLLSSPLSTVDIILGKFLAVLGFAGIMIGLLLVMGLSLSVGTQLDYGHIATCTIGVLLLMSAFAAIGLYISCLTRLPMVAAVLTFGILFILWIIHWASQSTNENIASSLAWMSIIKHQEPFYRGMLNSGDVAYYLIISGLFLLLSIRRLDAERLQS